MKRLTTLFTFLLFATMAFSQIPVTVSGTITDLDGNPVGDIEVHIYVDTTFAGFTYSSIVTTNADGTYSDTFDAPDADTQGGVSAWIPDCNQSQLFQMGYWSPDGGPVIDFVYCNVCSASISEFGNNSLQVTATGEAPFAYAWSEGSTTAIITPAVPGSYSVTIIDANGCVSSNFYDYWVSDSCVVYIDEVTSGELTAFSFGIAPYSYLWETGETTQVISIAGAGEYCLSVIDAVGCVASDCITVTDGCDLTVSVTESNGLLIPNISGQGAVSFLWSTGEATEYITVSLSDEYCVTVTDANGCAASDCFDFVSGFPDSCYVSLQEVQNGTWLYADAGGVAPFAYLWNTGETTANIEMAEDIEYCVTITDATGCESSSCFDNTPEPFLVYGYVHPYDSLTTEYIDGIAELYTIDGDIVTYVTSTSIDSNYYDFGEVTPGDYLTKAIVDGYLPTYHFVAEFWDEADIVSADAPLWWGYDISLLPLDDEFTNDGPALISGTVTGSNSSEIILYNMDGSPLAYIITDVNGAYSFDGLPYGTYQVYIEIPGYGQEFYTITLSPDNITVENANFNVNQNTITTENREVLLSNIVLSVFPNPTKNALTVNLDMNTKGNAVIQIVNSIGQEVLNDTFEQNKMLNVSTLSTGVYLIKVTTQEGIAVKQFIKE